MFRAVRELYRKLTVLDGVEFQYALRLHNSGAVYAKKLRWIEPLFERSHCLSQQERTTIDVEFNIVPGSPNPLNLLRNDDLNAGPSLYRKTGRIIIRVAVQ